MANFYQDVIQKSTSFLSPNRISDLDLLEPITRVAVQGIISDANTHGIQLMVFETYRSQLRQTALFNQGASQLRSVGVHHYGLACDLVKDIGGDPSWKGDFSFLREMARANGLIWGGDWGTPNQPHSFRDYDHVQRCTVARQAQLFRTQWYPTDTYNPYSDL
jgi:hypothetical protein